MHMCMRVRVRLRVCVPKSMRKEEKYASRKYLGGVILVTKNLIVKNVYLLLLFSYFAILLFCY